MWPCPRATDRVYPPMVEPGLWSEDILLPLPLGNRKTQGKRFCAHTMSFGQKTNIQKKSLKVCIDIIGNDLRMWKGCALSRWSTDFKHFHSEDGHAGLISDKRQSLVNYLWKGFRFLLHKVASTDLTFIVFVPGSKETMVGAWKPGQSRMNWLCKHEDPIMSIKHQAWYDSTHP